MLVIRVYLREIRSAGNTRSRGLPLAVKCVKSAGAIVSGGKCEGE